MCQLFILFLFRFVSVLLCSGYSRASFSGLSECSFADDIPYLRVHKLCVALSLFGDSSRMVGALQMIIITKFSIIIRACQ